MSMTIHDAPALHTMTSKAANKATKDILAAGDKATAEQHVAAREAHLEARAAHLKRAAELQAQGKKLNANPHIASAKKHAVMADKHISHVQAAIKASGNNLPMNTPIGAHDKPFVPQVVKAAPAHPVASPQHSHVTAQMHAATTHAAQGEAAHKASSAAAKLATKLATESNHAEHHEAAHKAHKEAAKAHLARAAELQAKGQKLQANPHIATAKVHEMHAAAHAQKHFLKGPKGGTYYIGHGGQKVYSTAIVPEKAPKEPKTPTDPTPKAFAATAPATAHAASAHKAAEPTPTAPKLDAAGQAKAFAAAGTTKAADGSISRQPKPGKLPTSTAPKQPQFYGTPEQQKKQHDHVTKADASGYMWHPSEGKWKPESAGQDSVYGEKGTHELPPHAYNPANDKSHPDYKPPVVPQVAAAAPKKHTSAVSSVTKVSSGLSLPAQAAAAKIGGSLPNYMYEVAAVHPTYHQIASPEELTKEAKASGHHDYLMNAPPEQFYAMKAFTNGDYHNMNDPFREGTLLSATFSGYVKHLDTLMENAPPLQKNLTVHRGVDMAKLKWPQHLLDNPHELVGATFESAGFNSGSTTKPFHGTKFSILCPAGSRGVLHVDKLSSHTDEQETLLHRSAKLRIISASKDAGTGKLHIIAELLPYEKPPAIHTATKQVSYKDFLTGITP